MKCMHNYDYAAGFNLKITNIFNKKRGAIVLR